jgi:hypothetical protein
MSALDLTGKRFGRPTVLDGSLDDSRNNALRKLGSVEPVVVDNNMRIIAIAALIILTLELAQAEPRQHNRNYILRRQEAGLVSRVPTTRRIIGKREIDIYRNGLMFEKDSVVGVVPRR